MNYPLKNIPYPHAHDVLCGRGKWIKYWNMAFISFQNWQWTITRSLLIHSFKFLLF
jgi:hypothetical protein